MRDKSITTFLGVFIFIYWVVDVLNNVFLGHRPTWLLWYSSAGLLFTSISLLTRNSKLISSAFCALFVAEGIWSIDFLLMLFFHWSPFGFTSYAFSAGFGRKDFIMTLYHLLMPIGLFIAAVNTPKVSKFGWVGALIYAAGLIIATELFAGSRDIVNCVHVRCGVIFSFIYTFPEPWRWILVVFLMTVILYIPSNILLVFLHKRFGRTSS